jgi:hypothetical protein
MSRQVLILTCQELVVFYELHGLLPGAIVNARCLPEILRSANEKAKEFGLFVFESVYETDNDKLELKPDIISWDELFNYYCFFIVGYSGIKLSQADVERPR